MCRSCARRLRQSAARLTLAAFAFFSWLPAWAECVQDEGATTLLIDGTSGCDSIVGQTGCTIDFKKNQSSCTFTRVIGGQQETVVASASFSTSSGGIWSTNKPIDTVIFGGATSGNNCGYSYTFDDAMGAGGFLKADGSFQNSTFASFCADESLEEAPPPPKVAETYPSCDSLLGTLDQTTVTCGTGTEQEPLEPSLVCNFQLEQPNAGANVGEYCCICGSPTQVACVAGTGECDDVIGDDPQNPDGRKNVRIDGGELLEFLETPGCVYSRARQTWVCT
jgi:hypothetical protein